MVLKQAPLTLTVKPVVAAPGAGVLFGGVAAAPEGYVLGLRVGAAEQGVKSPTLCHWLR